MVYRYEGGLNFMVVCFEGFVYFGEMLYGGILCTNLRFLCVVYKGNGMFTYAFGTGFYT